MYERIIKRLLDLTLSVIAGIVLAIPMLIVAVIIKVDDPGPALFKQKRVGKNKTYFWLYKFRTMKMNTPDIPTHLLEHPEQYITRTGHFLRKYSIDELPQLYNALRADISLIGPRPALWNQYDLLEERDRYGANDVRPGLTGWAQINGRDELEIPEKARLDGEYVAALKRGSWTAFAMDVKCFIGTIFSVAKHEGVVEGGTGELEKNEEKKWPRLLK